MENAMIEIAWCQGSDLFYCPNAKDCTWAAWLYSMWPVSHGGSLYWETTRDLMLAGV